MYDINEVKDELYILENDGLKSHPLRKEYEEKVNQLEEKAKNLLSSGVYKEETALIMYNERRKLGIEYKELSPKVFRQYIYDQTEKKYGSPYGPSFEMLKKNKTFDQIISSSCRPIENLDDRITVEGFKKWLKEKNIKF